MFRQLVNSQASLESLQSLWSMHLWVLYAVSKFMTKMEDLHSNQINEPLRFSNFWPSTIFVLCLLNLTFFSLFSKYKLNRKLWLITGLWQVVGMIQAQHNLEVPPSFRINLLTISRSRRVACIFCSVQSCCRSCCALLTYVGTFHYFTLHVFVYKAPAHHQWLFVPGKLCDAL